MRYMMKSCNFHSLHSTVSGSFRLDVFHVLATFPLTASLQKFILFFIHVEIFSLWNNRIYNLVKLNLVDVSFGVVNYCIFLLILLYYIVGMDKKIILYLNVKSLKLLYSGNNCQV